MRSRLIALVGCTLLAACDMPVKDPVPTNYVQPRDVKVFLDRAQECEHWAGEEAYDRVRGKEILQAVNRLRCADLDEDYAALRLKYAQNGPVSGDLITNTVQYGFDSLSHAQ